MALQPGELPLQWKRPLWIAGIVGVVVLVVAAAAVFAWTADLGGASKDVAHARARDCVRREVPGAALL